MTTTNTKRSTKGSGSLSRSKGKGKSRNWMMSFTQNGKRVQVSTGTADKLEARKILNKALGTVADGGTVDGEQLGKRAYRFADATKLWMAQQVIDQNSSRDQQLRTIETRLTPVFGEDRLDQITTERVKLYHAGRIEAGAAVATVHLELAILRRMLNVAARAGKFTGQMPVIETPEPDNARKHFFDRGQFMSARSKMADWLQDAATVAFFTGWRFASEILNIERAWVDIERGIVKIPDSKNGSGKTFPFRALPELEAAFRSAVRRHDALIASGKIVPWLFHRDGDRLYNLPTDTMRRRVKAGSEPQKNKSGKRRTGSARGWVMDEWHDACKAGGVPGLKPHDLRRTAARNLVRAGVSGHTCMALLGMKTRSILDRYDIIDEADLSKAVEQLAAAGAAASSKRSKKR